jgi:hypothetical protein
LHKGEIDLRVCNGTRVIILTVRPYYLTFSNRLILELYNYYFISILSRYIISIFYLALNEFKFIIEDIYYSFYNNNNIYYESSIYTNSLYIFDFDMPILNINS